MSNVITIVQLFMYWKEACESNKDDMFSIRKYKELKTKVLEKKHPPLTNISNNFSCSISFLL